MRIIVYGAGGVGGTIGARLHLSGTETVLMARGPHLEALRRDGLKFVAPDGEHKLMIPTAAHPNEVDWRADDVVLLTMKSQHTVAALDSLLAAAGPEVPVVCVQNGVANERMALRRFRRVYGMLVNLPAIHMVPGEVVTHANGTGGILDTGCYPEGVDEIVEELMSHISAAGFSAVPDPQVMRKKYAKLLMNLANLVQAATVPASGSETLKETEADALKTLYGRLRREALACFEAAGIDCATTEEVRARHENTYRMVDIEGYERPGGSSWQSLSRGTGNLETDYLNGEISLLGSLHGVPTPANRLCQTLAAEIIAKGLSAGSFQPSELLARLNSVSGAQGNG
ncbi:MAG: 2-dehydropantoate 2-reductase N-terminal domain-containing protein [Pseudomonadota bacterium]